MKTIPTIILLLVSNVCFGQKDLIGLFGKCDQDYSVYVCQQILFKPNKTFTFYDLLHLRGWGLTEGTWEMKGDTVILQSSKPPYTLDFRGTPSSDSITIYVTDSVEPYLLTPIALNTHQYSTDLSGAVRVPRQLVDTLYVSSFPCYSGPIVIDKEKIKSTDTIVVAMDGNVSGKHYFTNEKWLLKNKKLYHTQDSDGNFDPNKYFDKAKLTDLKYHKRH